MIAIPNMDKPKDCDGIGINIHFTDGHMELHILDECELIEIDDEIWEALKPKIETMSLAKRGWITDDSNT